MSGPSARKKMYDDFRLLYHPMLGRVVMLGTAAQNVPSAIFHGLYCLQQMRQSTLVYNVRQVNHVNPVLACGAHASHKSFRCFYVCDKLCIHFCQMSKEMVMFAINMWTDNKVNLVVGFCTQMRYQAFKRHGLYLSWRLRQSRLSLFISFIFSKIKK